MFTVNSMSRSCDGRGTMSIPTMTMIPTASRTSVWPRRRRNEEGFGATTAIV